MMSAAVNKDKMTGVVYRRWVCPSADAVFLLVHGLGAHSGRWEHFAEYFLANSISSYAIDLRGFGATQADKGHVDPSTQTPPMGGGLCSGFRLKGGKKGTADMPAGLHSLRSYFKDIQALSGIIKREANGKPVFLVGESMGGLVSFLLAEQQPEAFSGLVCIVPAFKNRLKFGWMGCLRIFLLSLIVPKRPVKLPFTHAMCTRDTECIKEMENDPYEHRYATPRLLLHIFFAGLRLRCCPAALKIPVLFLAAGDDDMLVDSAAVKKVYTDLKARDKEFIQYPEMFHALSMELGREKVFQDILQWVRARIKGAKR